MRKRIIGLAATSLVGAIGVLEWTMQKPQKVYVVFYMFDKVTASVGPWPGETVSEALESCQSNEPESNRLLDEDFANPDKFQKMRELNPGIERKDIRWTCIINNGRPYIEDAVRMSNTE